MDGIGGRAVVLRRLVVVLGLVVLSSPALATSSYCSPPSLPFCLGATGGFADPQAAESCRAKLEDYLSSIERHANCLFSVAEDEAQRRTEEGRREAAEVRKQGRKALARFECKARGGTACY